VWSPRLRYVGFSFVPPANPTRVRRIPEAQPNCASGNQNQDIPKDAFCTFLYVVVIVFAEVEKWVL